MTPTSDRDAAAKLAQRVENATIDPSKKDEADRPSGDKPPGFAAALMSEAVAPSTIARAADLSSADWKLVGRALQHYAICENG
jgi:hypothetical protein